MQIRNNNIIHLKEFLFNKGDNVCKTHRTNSAYVFLM